jgi:hypothetical protein
MQNYVNTKAKELDKLKIFMSVGDNESTGKASAKQYIQVAQSMSEIFKSNKTKYIFKIIKEAKHNEES